MAPQLPYAFVGALAALCGYVVYAVVGLAVTLGLVTAICAILRNVRAPINDRQMIFGNSVQS